MKLLESLPIVAEGDSLTSLANLNSEQLAEVLDDVLSALGLVIVVDRGYYHRDVSFELKRMVKR